MLGNKNVVSLILVATFLVTLLPFSMVTYAQPQNQEQQNVREQTFMEIAIQARERAYELRDLVIEETGNVPDDIEDFLNEADTLLAEGNIQKAIEAMNQYRNAYRYLHRYLEKHWVDTETTETVKGLLVAVDRANIRIQRISQIIECIRNTYRIQMDTQAQQYLSCVEGNLTEAKTNLERAREALVQYKNVTGATHNLTEANKNMEQAQVDLQLTARWTNRWRIRNFLGELERIRERIRARIQERMGQEGFNLKAILEELGYTSLEDFNQAIDELMENAEQMEIREAVQELWTIMEKLREMDLSLQNNWQGGY